MERDVKVMCDCNKCKNLCYVGQYRHLWGTEIDIDESHCARSDIIDFFNTDEDTTYIYCRNYKENKDE